MLAVGIDTLDIERVSTFENNPKFMEKYFTSYERNYCEDTVNRKMRLAGIFCVKEAFLKALGIGIGREIALIEIEVNHDRLGKPYLHLSDSALKIVNDMGYKEMQISITHTDKISTAICVLN